MSVYGTDYFVNNISVLEEALDNELNNFNTMMESLNIENINEMVKDPFFQIKTKIKTLWEKFINWFKSIIRTINSAFKINTLYVLKKKAENNKYGDYIPASIYVLKRDATDEYKAKSSDPDNILEVKEGLKNFISRNEEAISDVDNLLKQLSLNNSLNSDKIHETTKHIEEIIEKSDFKLVKSGQVESKVVTIEIGNVFFGCICDLNDQITSLNKLVKDTDKWVKNFYSFYNNKNVSPDDDSLYASYACKHLIKLLRDLTTRTFTMFKKSYSITSYYYLCALGKKKNDLKED